MNTFGLGKKGLSQSWLSSKTGTILVQLWKDAIRFSVTIKRKLLNRVEL